MNHFYFNIPGWFGFHDVYDRAVALAPPEAHFVEVGCWEGRSTAYLGVNICNSGKKIRLDCVDTWEGSREHVNDLEKSQIFRKFHNNMSIFNELMDLRIVRKESTEAAKDYDDGSLDFVFLDASHDAESVYRDIEAWKPKLSPSGVLAGDDVAWEGVRIALLRHQMGTNEHPLVMSGGVYKSWVDAPEHLRPSWITKVPDEQDLAFIEGQMESSVELLGSLLPGPDPQSCIDGHEEEFKDRMRALGRIP